MVTYVRTCESCQRVTPSSHKDLFLERVSIITGCCEFISLGFVFDLPKDSHGNTYFVVFVGQLSNMTYLTAVLDSFDGEGTTQIFIG